MVLVTAWAVAWGAALGLGLWILASLAPRWSRPRLARRIAPYLADVSASAREILAPPGPGPLPVVGLVFAPILARGQHLLAVVLGGADATTRRLRQAASPLGLAAFRSRQLLWGLAAAALGIGFAVAVGWLRPLPVAVQVVAVAAATVGGVLLPEQLLQRSAAARLARLDAELPVVLEFLTLCLSAGEGVLDAMRRVARVSHGELAGELAGVVASVGTGMPFAQSLADLASDLELPAFTRCVDQLLGALDRGTPLADVLRAQAQDARDEAGRRLLESAGKKEIAMLVPLVFLILPVTILFAIFPGIVVLQLGL
ncbi:MAG: type II secretion system F family protein [Salinibacterium sp.]|nr:type II secretion system F family protein [Salinibacterium sp.]